jgi:PAS domain S-box-containing protein
MIKSLQKLFQLNAVTIAVIYLVTGILWILFSDQLLAVFVHDIETLSKYSSIKGILFMMVTGVGLYFLIQFSNEQILKSQKAVDKALDAVKIATWSINLKTNENTTSTYHYKLFGLKERPGQWGTEDFYERILPDDLEYVKHTFTKAIETLTPYEAEYRIKWPDGSIRWMKSQGTVQDNELGEAVRISGVVEDITKKKKLEEEYAREKELFERIFEQIPVMVDIYDPEVNSIRVNEAFQEILGWSNAEIQEIDLLSACYPDPEAHEKAAKVMSEADGAWHEFEVQDKQGNTHIQQWSNIQLSDKSIIGIGLDITDRKAFERELKQRNEFIENTLENLPIGVAVNLIDSGKTTLMNKQFSEIYGWPKNTLKDVETFFEKVYPDEKYRKNMVEMIQADLASKKPERMHWQGIRITTRTGEEKIINAKNIPVYDQNLMISTVVDVTAQVEAEQRLAESEHNYRLLFQKSPQPMWIYNPENLKIIEVNNAAVKHYGYQRKEFYEMTLMDIRPEADIERVEKIIIEDQNHQLSEAAEFRHIKKSGEIIDVRISGAAIDYFGKIYRLVLVNDITKQKQAEEMVLASLVEGQNKERARIAQELHDGLGQYLAAANMNLDAVKNSISGLNERKQNQFEKGLNLLKHAITETGQISRNLMPRVVDDYGLSLAIESLVDNYSNDTEMDINYYHNIKEVKLPREVQLNLYRIAQEGLSNAVKYSEATKINIQLIKDELDLILTIDDNGIGVDTTSKEFNPGLGLQTIKTRIGALGGYFEFDSKPNRGTLLNIVVPIHKTNSSP